MRTLFLLIFIWFFSFATFSQTDSTIVYTNAQGITCSGTVDVPIKVSRFRKMLSMQGTIAWDTAVFRFDSPSSYGPQSPAGPVRDDPNIAGSPVLFMERPLSGRHHADGLCHTFHPAHDGQGAGCHLLADLHRRRCGSARIHRYKLHPPPQCGQNRRDRFTFPDHRVQSLQ